MRRLTARLAAQCRRWLSGVPRYTVQPDVSPAWPHGWGTAAGTGAGHDHASVEMHPDGLLVRQAGERLVLRWDTFVRPGYGPRVIPCPHYRGRKAIELAKIVPLAGLTDATAQALLTRIEIGLHNALAGRFDERASEASRPSALARRTPETLPQISPR